GANQYSSPNRGITTAKLNLFPKFAALNFKTTLVTDCPWLRIATVENIATNTHKRKPMEGVKRMGTRSRSSVIATP
ncbi:hypothetical protein U2084_15010, partial [Listeria monocytogenes]|uniref:hypothetical protein n=1 Tax=Listeria monocytogenes TaxID=1639 RepID=UPI002FDC2852